MSRLRALFGRLVNGIYFSSAPTLSNGEEHPLLLDASGNLKVTSVAAAGSAKSYVVAFAALAAPGGIFFEMPGVNGVTLSIYDIYFYKPSVSVEFKIQRLSSVGTGGTSSTPTPIRFKTSDGAASAAPKLYTVAPGGGAALVGNFLDVKTVTAGDNLGFTYGDLGTEPITIVNGESFSLTTDVAATVYGYVRWTEA